MDGKPNKSINVDKLLESLDKQVETAREDCNKVIEQAEEFLQRKQLENKKNSNETRFLEP